MKYVFRLRASAAALNLMGDRKQEIIDGLTADAEKLPLEKHDYAIFDIHDLNLKAIVQFHQRLLVVLTEKEYHQTTIPGSVKRN